MKHLQVYWHCYMLIVGEQAKKRIDPENSSALTFEKLLEAYKSQFNVTECNSY